MKKVLFSLLALALITGCSSKPAEATPTPTTTPAETETPTATPEVAKPSTGEALGVCEVASDNDTVTYTLNGTDGIVNEIEQQVKYALTADRNVDEIKKSFESEKESYKDVEGIAMTLEETDKDVIIKTVYQLDNLDEETLTTTGLDRFMNADGKFQLEDVKKSIESFGATCK